MTKDNAKIGFRLHSVEICNWGTFHNKTWKIEPNGNNSLLTGAIGSGKSTLVDALTCLIVPQQKISFNKAAGAEKNERNLLTYIKGAYKSVKSDDTDTREKAVSLRYNGTNDTTFSIIIANFINDGYQESVALAQVFWIENGKAQKLLIIREKMPLSIKNDFSVIEDAKELRKRMKTLSNTEVFDDNFTKYSQRFCQLFGMQPKAIDLFYQTVSMKAVSSLTLFVREQMLEQTNIKEKIEDLKKRFEDLNKALNTVKNARKQKDTLAPLVELCENFKIFEERILAIENIVQAVPSYFASKKIILLQTDIEDCERKLLQLNGQINKIEETLGNKRDAQNELKQDIRNNGGARLEQIATLIKQGNEKRKEKETKYENYAALAKSCELDNAHTGKTFFSNLKNAEEKITIATKKQEEISSERGVIGAKKTTLEDIIAAETKELTSLKQRKNQIPLAFLSVREQMASVLEINEDEIPFVGELLKIKENESDWEGVLERLLRGFGISMLVPEKYYKQISNYINTKRLIDANNKGMRFEYFRIPDNQTNKFSNNNTDADFVFNKIDIKGDTPFYNWLETELQKKFNLRGVEMDEFQRQSDVITKEGQIKMGSQRHTKDDRFDLWDKKTFILGWTNKEKVKAIEKYLKEKTNELSKIQTKLTQLTDENTKNNDLQAKLNQIIAYKHWFELNWKDEVETVNLLEKEQDELKNSNDKLKTFQIQLEQVTAEIAENEAIKITKTKDAGNLEKNIENSNIAITEAHQTLKTVAEKQNFFPLIENEIEKNILTIKNIDKIEKELNNKQNDEKDGIRRKQSTLRDKIIKQMKEYKNVFPSESLELSDDIEARQEYLDILNKIIKEGLPKHEATLKTMLNENTMQDITAFRNKLEMQEKEILHKIKSINENMREIEYNKDTYIELIADKNRDQDIKIFKEDLNACLEYIFSTSDAYTEDRFNAVQKILNRFRSNENKDIEWTNKVTDVRNWFDFNASEKYFADNVEKEFYPGSSGKSGGQKEKLAYTILASALAYQFGLKIGETQSKSFRFVVIDEAFGKGDNSSTEYGLELFSKLNLQLLIVTPLQKINIIENYVNAVHYVSNNTEGSSSELKNLTIEEYKTNKEAYNEANDM